MKMDKLLKQAQRMQAQMALAQEELEKTIIEGAAGGGMVKATVNGHGDVVSVSISKANSYLFFSRVESGTT